MSVFNWIKDLFKDLDLIELLFPIYNRFKDIEDI